MAELKAKAHFSRLSAHTKYEFHAKKMVKWLNTRTSFVPGKEKKEGRKEGRWDGR
jgi:hypothetical protein